MCLWNKMLTILTNSKDGQGHKYKYLDTNRKILSQEMLECIWNKGTLPNVNPDPETFK